ncbi:MOB kinase activator 1A [Aphelenchoides fujianensis]|nr:MOB kinase activator 1A [Aphelenchoides fujianensis]
MKAPLFLLLFAQLLGVGFASRPAYIPHGENIHPIEEGDFTEWFEMCRVKSFGNRRTLIKSTYNQTVGTYYKGASLSDERGPMLLPIEGTKEYVYLNAMSSDWAIPTLWSLAQPTLMWGSHLGEETFDRSHFFVHRKWLFVNQTAAVDFRLIYQKCVGAGEEKRTCMPGKANVSSYHDILDNELPHEMKAKIAFLRALTRAQGQTTTKGGGSARDPQDALIRHADATLGSGALRDVVRLPAGEDKNEWIAMNIVDFFHQISLLYGTITERCTAESCPRMSAGPDHEFFWADPRTNTPIACSAPEYINFLMTWVQDELDDESHFPSQIGKPFPANFMAIAQSIMKRLFRVYAHIYHHHFVYIEQLKAIEHLNTSFKHFLLFVREFQLVEAAQLAPLAELIEKLTSTA